MTAVGIIIALTVLVYVCVMAYDDYKTTLEFYTNQELEEQERNNNNNNWD